MTEKRYYAHKHLLHENQVHDRRCHNFMNIDETVEHMNIEYWKYKELEEENEQLKKENKELRDFEYWVFKSMGKINQNNNSNDQLDTEYHVETLCFDNEDLPEVKFSGNITSINVKSLARCSNCKYSRGYYSDSWCEKNNPQHDPMKDIECNDFKSIFTE